MDNIESEVKSIILTVAGLPDDPEKLADGTCLSDLGYVNGMVCDDLAEELDRYVKYTKPIAGVNSSELSTAMTVQNCVGLIKDKLK